MTSYRWSAAGNTQLAISHDDGSVEYADQGSRLYNALINGDQPITPANYEEPPAAVPQVVTRAQAMEALRQAGKLDAVEAAIAASDDGKLVIAWNASTEFHRDSELLNALAEQLSINEPEMDALFALADSITF